LLTQSLKKASDSLRTDAINQSLEKTITRARLSWYLAHADNDLDSALTLYERNTKLSEAVYTTLQGLEICFRNTVNTQLIMTYGPDWIANETTPLRVGTRNLIRDCQKRSGKSSVDGLVAELKFSFWVSLLAPQYDGTLWRTSLHKGFRAASTKRRDVVHGRMNALRRFRNRVAHHEPILEKAKIMHGEALEAIGWMCSATQAWVGDLSRFEEVAEP